MTSKKTGYLLGALAGVGVATAALAGANLADNPLADSNVQRGLLMKTSTAPIFAPPPGAPLSFADIFEKVSPAVVSINVTSEVDASALRRVPGFENFPFDIVPRQGPGGEEGEDAQPGQPAQPGPGGRGGQPRLPSQQSSGSGFFISGDGYIVTNNHVVENAKEIKVVLKDERELDAVVVGRDEGTDLAVLKVKGSGFPFVNFENAGKPRVGDWVITVGNPFGLGGTATAGIISAYGRDIGETFVDYIQIDAPINRGNSGGPTFDVYGRVIGVNTAIFSPSGGSVGIGFAIPADVADSITKQLISGGKITRGYIGASIQNFTAEMAEAQGLGAQRGAIVANVTPGGPSDRAGLLSGDIVTSVNGVGVKTSSELTREVAKAKAGDVLRLDLLRAGKRKVVEIRSGVRPTEKELAANDNPQGGPNRGGGEGSGAQAQRPVVLGLALAPLDEAARRRLSLDPAVRGVLIASIDQSSDAAQRGLRKDDIIVQASGEPVTTAAEFSAAVTAAKKAGRPSILVGVHRGGRTSFLPLKISG
ncbi:MAG: Do family serine endopeptidase [Pseudomonadota bacterium]|uniref:Do family serine endopeptidase n=1 Tax=unclassified Phenylobacterium TaxID=2640670 RepID=UPI0006F533C3|nr:MULTISPECIES: Do family serine endopeptidase [unclassified Phenylobacterium]KRB48936.1 serine protease [Phenylobacterium sp. Root700]MBT9472804.1 Do family serine endopeptidase [Phenylobacterium sp.]